MKNPKGLRWWGDLGLLAVLPWGADPHNPSSAPEAAGKGLWKAVNPIPRIFLSLRTWDLLLGMWGTGDLWDTCPKFLSRAGITAGSVTHPFSPGLGVMIPRIPWQISCNYQRKMIQKDKQNILLGDFPTFFPF